jgi:pimeloyl-ACP methyl ester carboxylesterase
MKRHILIAGVTLVAIAVLTGTTYEAVARRATLNASPFTGTMVEVSGGRRVHIDCRGEGSPTVVLEAGLDAFGAMSWTTIHDSIATTTRTCAYSRAGMLWSSATAGAFSVAQNAQELHAALEASGERAPWLFVGHSLGGPYGLAFTARYPDEVAGLAFIDASHPGQVERMKAARVYPAGIEHAALLLAFRIGPTLASMGVLRLMPAPGLAGWPERIRSAYRTLAPSSLAAMLLEARQVDASLSAARAGTNLGNRPILVLTAGRFEQGRAPGFEARRQRTWFALQDDMATWSTRSRHVVVRDAGHYVHADRPDLVTTELRALVMRVRVDQVVAVSEPASRTFTRSIEGAKPNMRREVRLR